MRGSHHANLASRMASIVCGLRTSASEASTSLAQRHIHFQRTKPGLRAMKTVSTHRKNRRVNCSDQAVTYLDETATVSRWYEDPDYVETDQPKPTLHIDASEQGRISRSVHSVRSLVNPDSQDVEMTSSVSNPQRSPGEVGNSTARADARLHAVTPMHESYSRALLAATPRTESSATQGSPGSISSRSYSTVYPLSVATGPPNTILTQREAVLMRNFTDNMALWVSFSLKV